MSKVFYIFIYIIIEVTLFGLASSATFSAGDLGPVLD